MDWLVRSVGFVDRMCCYSYSQEQIFSEERSPAVEVDTNSLLQLAPSWDMDDSERLAPSSVPEPQTVMNSHTHHHSCDGYPRKNQRRLKGVSPSRSTSTQTTMTTSTTTTVVTSSRNTSADQSSLSSQSMRRQHKDNAVQGHRKFHRDSFQNSRGAPKEIYCHSHSDGDLYRSQELKPVLSKSYTTVPFQTVTEGFQC